MTTCVADRKDWCQVPGDEELPELSDLTLAVRDLINAAREFSARTSRELGINRTDLDALALLEQYGPTGPSQLAARLGIRTASATVLIDRLESAGHVQRVAAREDRRRVLVVATPSARAASLALLRPSILALEDISRALDPEAARTVLDYLVNATRTMQPDG